MPSSPESAARPLWADPQAEPADRVAALIEAMTLREKAAQLYGMWLGADPEGPGVAPHQSELEKGFDLDALLTQGLGQLTRAFGTNPVDPAAGAAALARMQRRIVESGRFGIPALVHEECLAGFTTWKATAYPVPLSWGATFDPELVREMAQRIGASMRSVGVHQGLAPVLDVVRDLRWGRVEETIGEDPYLVGTVATAYVQGLESAGIVATLKHFAGYSASRAGRNLAPVSMGPREFADVILPPFEMAVAEGGVRSVMHSYAEVDGIPAAANRELLTGLLRDTWGFTGTVVADYFGIGFLKLLHGVADTWGDAARLALEAGVDVELPGPKAFLDPLIEEIEAGRLDDTVVDRALTRVLLQKLELGLLDPDWDARPAALTEADLEPGADIAGTVDLDPAEDRAVARRIAEEAVVLLKNDGTLPLTAPTCPSVSTSRPCSSRSARSSRTRTCGRRRAAPSTGRTPTASPPRSPRRGTRTSPWWCSATAPVSSAAARRARAATPPTCPCRGCRETCSRRCSTPARRSCSSSTPDAPTRSARPPTARPRSCRPSSPAKKAAGRSPACSRAP